MARRNKKLNKNKREAFLKSQSKTKKDYIISDSLNYFEYLDMFISEDEVKAEQERRNNLKDWNKGDTDEK